MVQPEIVRLKGELKKSYKTIINLRVEIKELKKQLRQEKERGTRLDGTIRAMQKRIDNLLPRDTQAGEYVEQEWKEPYSEGL